MVEIPSWGIIVMFIDYLRALLLCFTPAVFVVRTLPEGAYGANNDDVRIFLLDALSKEVIALEESVA